MTTHPQRFTVLLVPEHFEDPQPATVEAGAVRSALVEATGEQGETGYPRYAGEGVIADIDPRTRTVEAVLVDGAELDYGFQAKIAP
ncbi:hypothetical protein [Streptomyces fructofermentans]|uniref:Uncharacterized protein n=1 Tax=Streptomyces fructofermentans TaxID=152141 RepID=A0A918NN40_9ACTN|nr:hypothetical protein [Streptomyces fructofermentans]GGX82572.1 hypothetical protein GCM10010515_57630 [Streptomyces fructofermentans]